MSTLIRSVAGLASRPLLLVSVPTMALVGLQRQVPIDWRVGAGFIAVSLLAWVLIRAASWRLSHSGQFARRIVILGTGPQGYALAEEIDARPESPYVVTGLVEERDGVAARDTGVMCLGQMDRLDEVIEEVQPACIALALYDVRALPENVLLDARVRGIAVEEATTLLEQMTGKLAIDMLAPRSLFLSDGFHHPDFVRHSDLSQAITRVLNLAGALLGLVLLAPVCALIALAVRLESEGPVLFVQERLGRAGKPFGLIKFRTMRQDGAGVSEWVRDNTDRITGVGRVLRRFRLDEIPQLVNVLRGEMNLVGPRPHPTCNCQRFLAQIPYYGLRMTVRPGLTGWAQVRYGYANNLAEEREKMKYDLYYIKHRSLWLDLRILVETAAVLIDAHAHHATPRRADRVACIHAWPGVASGVTLR